MKEGIYNVHLSADSYDGEALINVEGRRGEGRDGVWQIAVNFTEFGARCGANAVIDMPPDVVHNSRIPAHYAVDLNGSSDEESFSLLGIGPLGLIIELKGQWTGG